MQIYQFFCFQEWAYVSGQAAVRMHAKQMEHNNSVSNMYFMTVVTGKGLL